MYVDIIKPISSIFDIVGTILIIFGALVAIYKILKIEIKFKKKFLEYENTKREFIQKLIFGLDFLIAGDVLKTVIVPGLEELIRLVTIVAIRTVLGYFLSKEVHLHKVKLA